jgi:hypothetical protein
MAAAAILTVLPAAAQVPARVQPPSQSQPQSQAQPAPEPGSNQADSAYRPLGTAQSVLACMRANVPQSLRIQTVALTVTDGSGNRHSYKGKLLAMREDDLLRATLRIGAPSDLAGAAYLVRESGGDREDAVFVYLPALGRVRRISGSGIDGSLLGTDFSYSDLKNIQNAYSGGHAELLAPTTEQGRPTYSLQLTPGSRQPSEYSAVRIEVDRKTCFALKADFYRGDEIVKQLDVPADTLQQSGKYWYAAKMQMRDLKRGSHTELHVLDVSSEPVPKGAFDPHSFYRAD